MVKRHPFLERIGYLVGSSPLVLVRTLLGLPRFLLDWRRYQCLDPHPSFRVSLRHLFPILTDRSDEAGVAGGYYFHQDLWAARRIFRRRPAAHVDIGSRVDGFIAHLLVFMPVTVIDIRSLESDVAGLNFSRDDATQLAGFADRSIDSLSSLHAAEHFGLGRYSDPVDPGACFRFMATLQRVLAPGGRLYFSVPVGRERLEFNAHRVFAPQTIIDSFPGLRLVSFAWVDDDGQLHEDARVEDAAACGFGCGLFEFTTPS
jgi:hypothetical protein